MEIYIIHYSKLKERKIKCDEQFKNYKINYIDETKLYPLNYNKYEFNKNLKYGLKDFDVRYNIKNFSILRQHLYAISLMKNNYSIIFEDDVIIKDNFHEHLQKYLMELDTDFDFFFFGNGFGISHQDQDGIFLRDINKKVLVKCMDSYIISKKCSKIIFEYIDKIDKIDKPIDYFFEDIIRKNNLKVYWCEPCITNQGSQIGIYKSSLGHEIIIV